MRPHLDDELCFDLPIGSSPLLTFGSRPSINLGFSNVYSLKRPRVGAQLNAGGRRLSKSRTERYESLRCSLSVEQSWSGHVTAGLRRRPPAVCRAALGITEPLARLAFGDARGPLGIERIQPEPLWRTRTVLLSNYTPRLSNACPNGISNFAGRVRC
jgi:hypothetical protein